MWNQPWLKGPLSLQPITEVQIMWDALTVGHLFKPNTKEWNENFIRYVFNAETSNQILQTPLLQSVRVDKATWRFEKNGLYSVCNAYREIINSNDVLLHHRVSENWNIIWNLKLPPKIKNFLWRICRNCLPTRMRLITKGSSAPQLVPYATMMRKMRNICFLRVIRVLVVDNGWVFGPQFSRFGLILPPVLI